MTEMSIQYEELPEGLSLTWMQKKNILSISVAFGQPRDSNNNAKYVIWDSSMKDSLDVRFVPYDIAAVVQKN